MAIVLAYIIFKKAFSSFDWFFGFIAFKILNVNEFVN